MRSQTDRRRCSLARPPGGTPPAPPITVTGKDSGPQVPDQRHPGLPPLPYRPRHRARTPPGPSGHGGPGRETAAGRAAMGRHLPGTGHHSTAPQRRPRPHLEPPLRDRPAAPSRRVRAMGIAETGRGPPHPGTQRPQPQGKGPPARMGQADGGTPPQDPRRLPRMPRGHPQRKPSTATTMSTGEPRCPENGQVRFGGRPSEKGHFGTSLAAHPTSSTDLWGPGAEMPRATRPKRF